METKRSPRITNLYSKRTDCVVEWVCGILNEEDSLEFENFKKYMDDYLAYSEEHHTMIDFYFQNSLRSIRKLQDCSDKIEEVNSLFDTNIVVLSRAIENKQHDKVKKEMENFFVRCGEIKAA